jgi:hypothetical protein
MLARNRKRFDSTLTKAVVKVGIGRGFVIQHSVWIPPGKMKPAVFTETKADGKPTRIVFGAINGKGRYLDRRLVVTAAHCLPYLPPCHVTSPIEECTYKSLLGTLDSHKPEVWATCLFVDPVADIAVLGSPDGLVLAEAYEALTDGVPVLRVGKPPREGSAWVLTLGGQWVRCTVGPTGDYLWIDNTKKVEGGMSGSPILSDHGTVIGVLCVGNPTIDSDRVRRPTRSFPHPVLAHHLPGWLLRKSH